MNDFADSLNTITDPVIGCASGVLRPEEEMREVIEKQMNNVLRACTHTIGLGDPYRGGFTGVEVCFFIFSLCPFSFSFFP